MERITINNITPKMSKTNIPFWACECPNGSKYTVWDNAIADVIAKNLNVECEAETKQTGNFWNIRAFSPHDTSQTQLPPQVTQPQVTQTQLPPQVTQINEPSRDDRICAQWMVGRATEILIAKYDLSHMTLMQIAEAMSEIIAEEIDTWQCSLMGENRFYLN